MLQRQRRAELARLLKFVYTSSSLMPFRWHGGKYMCFYCSTHFHKVAELREHSETHTEIDFNNLIKNTAVKHYHRIKLDVADVYCTDCSTELQSFDDFIEHLSRYHGEKFPRDVVGRFEVFILKDDEMSCLECDKTFRHFSELLKHSHRDHTDVEKHHKYLCEICGQGFVDKGSVTTHISQAHYVQQCKYCSLTFDTCYGLDKHVGAVHKVEKCQCQFCFEVLPNRYQRKRHLALVHDWGTDQLKCDVCKKIFTRNSKLLLHKRRVHMKEKNISCEECGMLFFNLDALDMHKIRHRDEHPLRCGVCLKIYRNKHDLVIHIAHDHEMDPQ